MRSGPLSSSCRGVRSERALERERTFHRFSAAVWVVWLVPYVIGMLVGIPAIKLASLPATLASLVVAGIAALVALSPPRIGSPDRPSPRKSSVLSARMCTMQLLTVRNRTLLLIAGIVWLIAGINIVRIGLEAYGSGHPNLINIGLSVVIGVGVLDLRLRKARLQAQRPHRGLWR